MAHMTYKEIWVMIGGILLGTALAILILEVESARAELNDSSDRQSQCAWVKTAASPDQPTTSHALASEPNDELLIDEDVNIVTGLYTRFYSLQQNGRIDYKTARQIITSEYNEYWNTVVDANAFPLFYWDDQDGDGIFDMWVDQQGDGHPCDIIPYQLYNGTQRTQLVGHE